MLTQSQCQWIGVAALCLSAFAPAAHSQEVRWKFAAGDQLAMTQQQTTAIETRVEKRDSKIVSSVSLAGNWQVTDVSDANVASITQTVESIKISIDNPSDRSKSVAVDTTSSGKPTKKSRELYQELQPLVGMMFNLEINDRGEVTDVVLPADTQQRLGKIPSDSWLKALLNPEKLKSQIQSMTLPLPERDLNEGQSVELAASEPTDTVIALPPSKRKMTYNGKRTSDGRSLDQFSLSTLEKFAGASTAAPSDPNVLEPPSVATFEWSGDMLFDREAGHCSSYESQTTVKTSQSHRDMKMSSTITVDSNFQLQRK